MDSEIFLNWFTHHFLVHSLLSRPILLLLYGHSTHYNPSFVRSATEDHMIVFSLPPNTTHLTQPLDKDIFGFLKTYWNQSFMSKNPGRYVAEYDFMPLFSKAWYLTKTIANIMSAFRTTGVYPFDCNAIEVIDSTPHINNPVSLTERTRLTFIPLYSPACKSSTHRCKTITKPPVTFISEEIACFIRRYEEGYDINTDECYNLWLKKYERSGEFDSSRLSCETSLESSTSTRTSPLSNLLIGEASSQSRSILKKLFHFQSLTLLALIMIRHLQEFLPGQKI